MLFKNPERWRSSVAPVFYEELPRELFGGANFFKGSFFRQGSRLARDGSEHRLSSTRHERFLLGGLSFGAAARPA
jgi:hypothetical protein